MNHKHQGILSLICLVSFIYVLRDHKTSPIGFLQHQTSRLLDSSTSLSAVLCEGVDQNDPITESERDQALSFRSSISKFRDGNPLMTYLNSTKSSTEFASEYVPPLVKTLIPWAVFFVISLVGCIGFVTNWCCMYCCKCGCRCCKTPKTPRFQRACRIGTAVFVVLTFGAGIAGIAMSAKFPPTGKQFMCSTAVLIDKLIDGSPSDHWVGALPAVDKLVVVLDNLETVSAKLDVTLLAPRLSVVYTTQYTAQYTSTHGSFVAFRDTYKQKTVARGDKTVAATYIPTYSANMESSDPQTGGAGALIAELEGKDTDLSNAAGKYTAGVTFLKTPVFLAGALGVFGDIRDSAVNVSKNITTVKEKLVDSGSSGRTGMDAIGGGLIGVFAIKMLVAILSMISIILISRGVSRFNKILHCNWCTLGFIVILGWILATVLFPLSVILFEACEVVENVLVDPVFFNRTMDKVFNDTNKTNDDPDKNSTRDTLYRCFYGDGDLLASYRVYLFPFQNISDALDLTAPMDASAPGTVINSVQLNRQIPLVDNYKNGLISDAPEATTDLTKLNSYTNNDGCSQIHDTWLFASGSCGASDGTKFTSGVAADFNIGSQTCIGFDQWSSTASDIQARYTSARFSGCPQVNSKTPEQFRQDFVNDFKASRNAVTTLFTNIASSLQTQKSSNDDYMNIVLAYTAQFVKHIRQDYDPLYQALSNQTVGIMPNTYCTFVKGDLIEVEEKLCYRFAPVIFQVTIVMIISSFIALFSVIMIFCSAKRNLVGEKPYGHDRRGKYKSASRTEV